MTLSREKIRVSMLYSLPYVSHTNHTLPSHTICLTTKTALVGFYQIFRCKFSQSKFLSKVYRYQRVHPPLPYGLIPKSSRPTMFLTIEHSKYTTNQNASSDDLIVLLEILTLALFGKERLADCINDFN